MSFKKNVAANYASQLYVTLIGVGILPLYLSYMGAESYGLIGFFSLLQSWFGLLDLGLTPTISRETARFQGGALSARQFRQLFRALACIFFGIAILGAFCLFFLANWIANQWLNSADLPRGQIVLALKVMAVCVALRWVGGLYRGVVSGSEQLVWLSGFNALIATLRFAAVFVPMLTFGFNITVFFIHQLVVAVFEVSCLAWRTYTILPRERADTVKLGWSLRPVLTTLKFSMTVAITSSVWIFATQTDKLILSGILPLGEYAYFALATLVAGAITLLVSPITLTLMPRLTRLHAEGRTDSFLNMYRQATKLVSVIASSAAIFFVICAEPLLFVWTGDTIVAEKATPILQLYAAGNGVLALGAFPFYLQYARGNLKYHLIGNGILIILLLPNVLLAAKTFGGIGAGWVWLGINVLYLVIWVAYVHHRLEPGLHQKWLLQDILQSVSLPAFLGLGLWFLPIESHVRSEAFLSCLLVGIAMLVATIPAIQRLRR